MPLRDAEPACAPLLPQARPYLMYGLTEAFRATYLPPEEVDRRPDSIGKAIPNSEILVLREDGSAVRCRTSRANWCSAVRWWRRATGTTRKRRPSASSRCRAASRPVLPEYRRVLRRHRAARRRGLPVLHRPARRDDQDLGLPRQPDRGRGGAVRDAAGRRVRGLRRAASGAGRGGRGRGRRRPTARRSTLRRLLAVCREQAAGLHGAGAASSCARARCRATRTARSIASRSPPSYRQRRGRAWQT